MESVHISLSSIIQKWDSTSFLFKLASLMTPLLVITPVLQYRKCRIFDTLPFIRLVFYGFFFWNILNFFFHLHSRCHYLSLPDYRNHMPSFLATRHYFLESFYCIALSYLISQNSVTLTSIILIQEVIIMPPCSLLYQD